MDSVTTKTTDESDPAFSQCVLLNCLVISLRCALGLHEDALKLKTALYDPFPGAMGPMGF